MKLMDGKASEDFVCIAGSLTEIGSTLNKINSLYDLQIVSSCMTHNDKLTVIVKRIRRAKDV